MITPHHGRKLGTLIIRIPSQFRELEILTRQCVQFFASITAVRTDLLHVIHFYDEAVFRQIPFLPIFSFSPDQTFP